MPTPSPSSRCINVAHDLDAGAEQDCHKLNFEYEVEIHPNTSLNTFEQNLIPSIEASIMSSLLPLVVGECSNDESVRRLLSEQNLLQMRNAMNTHRRAEIFGLSTSPTDLRRGAGSNCRAKTSTNHKCSVVSGATIICSNNYSKDKKEVLKIIQDKMEDDAYVDAHKDIVKIYFLRENEVDGMEDVSSMDGDEDGEGDEDEAGDVNSADSTSASNSTTAASKTNNGLEGAQLWAVILGSAAAIAVFILVGRKLIEEDYDHPDAYEDDDADQDGDKSRESKTSSEDDQV